MLRVTISCQDEPTRSVVEEIWQAHAGHHVKQTIGILLLILASNIETTSDSLDPRDSHGRTISPVDHPNFRRVRTTITKSRERRDRVVRRDSDGRVNFAFSPSGSEAPLSGSIPRVKATIRDLARACVSAVLSLARMDSELTLKTFGSFLEVGLDTLVRIRTGRLSAIGNGIEENSLRRVTSAKASLPRDRGDTDIYVRVRLDCLVRGFVLFFFPLFFSAHFT